MVVKKDFDIVDIDLGISLSEELKQQINEFNEDIKLYTLEKEEYKLKKLQELPKTKTQEMKLAKLERSSIVKMAFEYLKKIYDRDNQRWVSRWELALNVGLEPSSIDAITLSRRLLTYLKKEKKWFLLKKKRNRSYHFKLSRFE